jgi:HAD superfamily hydrolase (TIGR01509 family)
MAFSRKKYVGVLWDIDGTLIDSEPLHDEAVISALKDMGFGDIGLSLDMLGSTWEQTWESVGGKAELLSKFKDKSSDYYLANLSTLKARSIAVELVHKIAALGIRQAAVSNSPRHIVEANLKHLGIFELMATTISLNECAIGKPHPDPYLAAAKSLNVDIRECIAVEDSPRGAQAAKAAGALTLFWPQKASIETEHCDLKIFDLMDFSWFDYLPTSKLVSAKELKQ